MGSSADIFLIIVLAAMTGSWLLTVIIERLNLSCARSSLPEEFAGLYDAEKYRVSQEYLRTNTRFRLLYDTLFTGAAIAFILAGGFNVVDRFARGTGHGEIVNGLIFAGILSLMAFVFRLPFNVYRTFVIEEKFGFNRTTVRTFIADTLKGLALAAALGGLVFAGLTWFFLVFGTNAWWYSWIAVTVFELAVTFIAPVVILPLFNKFIPLENGELKTAVETYARKENFKMKGLFKMDGSRRSTKSNAFFTGYGRFRRIALFDTLIARHTVDELVSILAHEMGHYRKLHIQKSILLSIMSTGLMLFILSLFIHSPGLSAAFRMENMSVYAGIVFFGFLYSPLSFLISIWGNILSRKHEYEADAYAALTYGKPGAMIDALKKLSVDNLSNLTPHPAKVFLEYSHPPVLERIKAIKALNCRGSF